MTSGLSSWLMSASTLALVDGRAEKVRGRLYREGGAERLRSYKAAKAID